MFDLNDDGDYVDDDGNKVSPNDFKNGKKFEDKEFFWHTGFPGGIQSRNVTDRLARQPEHVLQKAVERMLAKGPLRNQILTHLKIYAGAEHPHLPQSPEILDVGSMNPKNRKRVS